MTRPARSAAAGAALLLAATLFLASQWKAVAAFVVPRPSCHSLSSIDPTTSTAEPAVGSSSSSSSSFDPRWTDEPSKAAAAFGGRNRSCPRPLFSSSAATSGEGDEDVINIWEKMATSLSGKFDDEGDDPSNMTPEEKKEITQLSTLLRVGIPSLGAGALATLTFPAVALGLASMVEDAGAFAVLSQDSSQFVQNFLTVSSLLFSILVGQTYYFMYTQQESVYYALFAEVTEAKSLLEQVALVCQGRAMYSQVLRSMAAYVRDDLKRLDADPARLLSSRPVDDPLESIMYMTSVGVPSGVYETVRSLRQARAARLGALQRKLPRVHMNLLWLLAATELCSFPLLGAGTQTLGGYNILTVEGTLFGLMTVGIVMTLRVVGELWRPAGGAYNVDAVLSVMVRGLESELNDRLSGKRRNVRAQPTPQFRTSEGDEAVLRVTAAHAAVMRAASDEAVGGKAEEEGRRGSR